MEDGSFEALRERLDHLEREVRHLRGRDRRRGWVGLAALAAVAVAVLLAGGPRGPSAGRAQVAGPRPAPGVPGPDPIRLGIGTEVIESGQYLLRDKAGNLLAVLAVHRDGSPILSFHARNQSARLMVRVEPNGEPGLVFLDKDGRRPVEVVVDREGPPRLKLIEREEQNLFPGPSNE